MTLLSDLTEARLTETAIARGVPRHLVDGLVLYVLRGIQPGSFLEAVLSNDLSGAFGRADADSRAGMFQLVMFLHNDVPAACQGSSRKYVDWIQSGGLKGLR